MNNDTLTYRRCITHVWACLVLDLEKLTPPRSTMTAPHRLLSTYKEKERLLMQKKWMALLLSLLMAAGCTSCIAEEPVQPAEAQSSAPLQKPEPGENYYGYINFEYLSNGQIPYDKSSYGTFDSIQDNLEKDLSDLIDRCVAKTSFDHPFEQYIKEMYEQYMDVDAREKNGIADLTPIIGAIQDCKTVDEWVAVSGSLYTEYGISSLIRFNVQPDSYDTSVTRLMLSNINTCGSMKENFTRTDAGTENVGSLTEDVLTALEVDPKTARERAAKTARMVTDIASAGLDSSEMLNIEKHYNLYTIDEFAKLYSNVDMDNLMKSFQWKTDAVIVYDVSQAEKANSFFTEEHLQELKDYSLVCIMYDYGKMIPPSYQNNFKDTNNMQKMDEKAKRFVCECLEEEIGILYGKETCTTEVMTAARKMLDDLKTSCGDLIRNSDRLSEDSVKKLTGKLDNMIFLLGYNENYQCPFEITPAKDGGNLLKNSIAVKRGQTKKIREKLSRKAERNTWDMTPVTVNAVYNPAVNTVTIPAVMLSKSAFDPANGEYKNLGMLGYVIAHEMNHAFDSNGYKYDANGCYRPDWMNQKDRDAYQKIMDKATAYYDQYQLLDVYNINGAQTLSENLADLAAVQCILHTTNNKDQQKQIFEGIATQWASLVLVTDVLKQLCGDEHSPEEARVNAVVSSTDQFYEVYDIKQTDKMYVAPENRIKVW